MKKKTVATEPSDDELKKLLKDVRVGDSVCITNLQKGTDRVEAVTAGSSVDFCVRPHLSDPIWFDRITGNDCSGVEVAIPLGC